MLTGLAADVCTKALTQTLCFSRKVCLWKFHIQKIKKALRFQLSPGPKASQAALLVSLGLAALLGSTVNEGAGTFRVDFRKVGRSLAVHQLGPGRVCNVGLCSPTQSVHIGE